MQDTHRPKLIPPLIPYLSEKGSGRPMGPFILPLSPDHQLITLVQYNVLRATLTNMAILSYTLPHECGGALIIPIINPPSSLPPSLLPTALQKSTVHENWIDTFPDPTLRNNLIRQQGTFDPDDLCCDLVGGLYEGFDEVETRGIFAWSDPWLADGWEVSEGFARKWGFLLRGCTELMEATNRWRDIRGEDRLVFEV